MRLAVVVAGLAAATASAQSTADISAGSGTLYVPAFPNRIIIIDEASAQVVDEIEVPRGAPRSLVVSEDRRRFYMLDPTFEHLTTADVAGRMVTDSFTLTAENRRVRIRSFRVAPDGETAILHLDAAVKHIDRFEVEPHALVLYDVTAHAIIKTLDWPTGEPTISSRMLFSPDGQYLYYFDRDVVVLDTEDFAVVDRWEFSQPTEAGVGRFNFGFATDLVYEDPGFFTGLFRLRDPAQNRDLMGIARIDVPNRDVEFYTIGPQQGLRFALAPGRRTAYGLVQEIGDYEFWTFDLERREVGPRRRIAGRPRMDLDVSTNGQILYVSQAGNTIDYYDANSFDHLQTLTLDGDMTASLIVLPSAR